MVSYTVKQTVVENLNADLDGKQPAGDYPTNASLTESLQSNLLNYTTNRILEIPQDILYDIVDNGIIESKNNRSLRILKGTKIWFPQGFEADGTTRKFNSRILQEDFIVPDQFYSNDKMIEQVFAVFGEGGSITFESQARVGSNVTSGATPPTEFLIGAALWYDTSENFVKYTKDSGKTWIHASFPLLEGSPISHIDTTTNEIGWISGVKTIFNGFGYMGSTVFALPGVKVQIPNGKNQDGTYKSFIYTVSSVLTCNIFNSGPVNGKAVIVPEMKNVLAGESLDLKFDSNTGYMSRDIHRNSCIVANLSWTTSGINSFKPYSVDSIVNSNSSNFSQAGKSYLSSLGMPSNKYIDLTLGASGATYTAPANGWFCLIGPTGGASGYIGNGIIGITTSGTSVYGLNVLFPVKKNDVINVLYTSATILRFVYAQGEQ